MRTLPQTKKELLEIIRIVQDDAGWPEVADEAIRLFKLMGKEKAQVEKVIAIVTIAVLDYIKGGEHDDCE